MTFCRLHSRQISTLKPQLDGNNVRLIGIGLEELGVEEFVKGEFFKGELFIDTKQQCYKALGFRRMNIFNVFPAIFSKSSRNAMSKAKEDKIDGNFKGDGMQNGGVLVVSAGGKSVLLNFKQDQPSDHVDPNEVLKSLGIESKVDFPEFSRQEEGSGATGGSS